MGMWLNLNEVVVVVCNDHNYHGSVTCDSYFQICCSFRMWWEYQNQLPVTSRFGWQRRPTPTAWQKKVSIENPYGSINTPLVWRQKAIYGKRICKYKSQTCPTVATSSIYCILYYTFRNSIGKAAFHSAYFHSSSLAFNGWLDNGSG